MDILCFSFNTCPLSWKVIFHLCFQCWAVKGKRKKQSRWKLELRTKTLVLEMLIATRCLQLNSLRLRWLGWLRTFTKMWVFFWTLSKMFSYVSSILLELLLIPSAWQHQSKLEFQHDSIYILILLRNLKVSPVKSLS